jgi:hypothetical protein
MRLCSEHIRAAPGRTSQHAVRAIGMERILNGELVLDEAAGNSWE